MTILKPSRNKKRPKFFLAVPKMVSFFTNGSWEKDTILVAARNVFSPSYFVAALVTYFYIFCIILQYSYFLGNFRCEIDLNALLEIISNICVPGRCEILIGFLQLHAQNWMTLCFPGSAIHSLNNCLAHACMYLTNIFSLNYSLLIYVACPKTFTEN